MNTPVSFELAKLLKEKGFSWECSHFYCRSKYYRKFYLTTGTEYESDRDCIWDWNLNGGKSGNLTKTIPYPNDTKAIYYSAPTIIEVIMWLYEKHGIWIQVISKNTSTQMSFKYEIKRYEWDGCITDDNLYNSPTEANESGIKHVLENLI